MGKDREIEVATTTKKVMARPIKRSKAEIEKEFDQVRTQVEESRQQVSPKMEELAKVGEAELRRRLAFAERPPANEPCG